MSHEENMLTHEYTIISRWTTEWQPDELLQSIRYHIIIETKPDNTRVQMIYEAHRGDIFVRARHYTTTKYAHYMVIGLLAAPLGHWVKISNPVLDITGG